MAKRKRRKDDPPYRVPEYDDLADRRRDTGAATPNRVVVAESRTLAQSMIAGVAAKRDAMPTVGNYAHDPLIWMLNRGTISARLAAAGSRFRTEFQEASSSNVPAMDLEQPMGQGSKSPLVPAGGACAVSWGQRVQPALAALGPPDAPMRLVAWHVLGLGKSLRAFAKTVGWEGVSPRPQMAASGIFTSALRALADHYGLGG